MVPNPADAWPSVNLNERCGSPRAVFEDYIVYRSSTEVRLSALSSIHPRPREIAPIVQAALADLNVPEFPCTLRFWDGSTLGDGGPVVHVRDPSAVAYLLHAPGQIGLARAWV